MDEGVILGCVARQEYCLAKAPCPGCGRWSWKPTWRSTPGTTRRRPGGSRSRPWSAGGGPATPAGPSGPPTRSSSCGAWWRRGTRCCRPSRSSCHFRTPLMPPTAASSKVQVPGGHAVKLSSDPLLKICKEPRSLHPSWPNLS